MKWRVGSLAGPLILAIACGGTTPSPSLSPTTARPETAWQRAIDAIDDNGQFSLEAALNLFATAYGPLPGVHIEQDTSGAIFDRTIAIRAVLAHRDELTPEQQAAVEAYLEPPEDAELIVVPPVSESRNAAIVGAVSDEQKQAILLAATEHRGTIAQQLGRDFVGDLNIHFIESAGPGNPYTGGGSGADAHSDWPGGVFGDCEIRIFGGTSANPSYLHAVLAHEIFHCFQMDGYRAMGAFATAPAWVVEGQASWVGAALATDYTAPEWSSYLTVPTDALTRRAYDAIGFYAHLEETGTDPWTVFPEMWAAGSNNIVIFEQANANTDVFLDSWASSVMREPSRSRAWDTTGPGITEDSFAPPWFSVGDGTRVDLNAAFFTNNIRMLQVTTDLLHVSVDGHGRLNDRAIDTTDLGDVWFCVEGHDCEPKCPDDRDRIPAIQGTIRDIVAIASTGGLDGTIGFAQGRDLPDADECETPEPSRDPDPDPEPDPGRIPCANGCAMSNGDPHIVTVDKNAYDFQAAGEFVLLRSSDGSVEIQGRQVPLPDTDGVTINTAVAMRVDGHRVGFYADQGTSALRATLDGAPVDPAQATAVGGGGLRAIEGGLAWEVSFPDGSFAYAIGLGSYGINVLLEPTEALAADGRGVMGQVPEGSWAPTLPDGSALAAEPPDLVAYWNELYVRFAEAWRVTQETSLFDYAPGETAATFTIPAYPPAENLVRLEDLTDEQRAAGEQACGSIGDPLVHAQCVFDVAVTLDSGWADGYESTLTLVETGALPSTGAQARVVNMYTENGQPVEVDVYAYTWSEAEMIEAAALVATVPYGQASAWFNPGLYQSPIDEAPSTRIQVFRRGDQSNPLVGVGEFLGPGTVTTIAVWTDEGLGGEAGAWQQTIYAEHPTYPVPEAPAGAGLLVTRNHGLEAAGDPPILYASVGDGCLEHPLADPSFPFPQPQPIGNDLAIPAGEHTLTLHAGPPLGEVAECDDKPVGPGIPMSVSPGDRFLFFPYRLPGATELSALVVPFGTR